MTTQAPPTIKVRAIDIRPGRYALWCQFEEGEPFANEICLRRWSEDRTKIVFMLDSHNFVFKKPDEELEVIVLPTHGRDFTALDENDRARMGNYD